MNAATFYEVSKSFGRVRALAGFSLSLRAGELTALLGLEGDLEVVGTAGDGEQALRLVRELRPDVLVADIEMPRLSGLDLAARVRDECAGVRVVIVTTFARTGYLRRALEAGARGYLLKDAPAHELAGAIRRVCAGGRVIDPALAEGALDALLHAQNPLTSREAEVLRLVEAGLGTAAIAARLSLSSGTVRNYLSEAMGKLNASGRAEAAAKAREAGWL